MQLVPSVQAGPEHRQGRRRSGGVSVGGGGGGMLAPDMTPVLVRRKGVCRHACTDPCSTIAAQAEGQAPRRHGVRIQQRHHHCTKPDLQQMSPTGCGQGLTRLHTSPARKHPPAAWPRLTCPLRPSTHPLLPPPPAPSRPLPLPPCAGAVHLCASTPLPLPHCPAPPRPTPPHCPPHPTPPLLPYLARDPRGLAAARLKGLWASGRAGGRASRQAGRRGSCGWDRMRMERRDP